MTFQESVQKCFREYATFSGRAARPEFWWFALFLLGANIVLGLIDNAIFWGDTQVLGPLFTLATIIPAIAVSVRRLHDIGKSGWWVLLHLIPIIGFLVMLYFYVQPTEPGENEYGPAPTA
jgi:uncharacterized membrane protein YhaH (DUF805 family)